eukprot:scaffold84959_cov63-Phaeocystis_antarctica.AAC.1
MKPLCSERRAPSEAALVTGGAGATGPARRRAKCASLHEGFLPRWTQNPLPGPKSFLHEPHVWPSSPRGDGGGDGGAPAGAVVAETGYTAATLGEGPSTASHAAPAERCSPQPATPATQTWRGSLASLRRQEQQLRGRCGQQSRRAPRACDSAAGTASDALAHRRSPPLGSHSELCPPPAGQGCGASLSSRDRRVALNQGPGLCPFPRQVGLTDLLRRRVREADGSRFLVRLGHCPSEQPGIWGGWLSPGACLNASALASGGPSSVQLVRIKGATRQRGLELRLRRFGSGLYIYIHDRHHWGSLITGLRAGVSKCITAASSSAAPPALLVMCAGWWWRRWCKAGLDAKTAGLLAPLLAVGAVAPEFREDRRLRERQAPRGREAIGDVVFARRRRRAWGCFALLLALLLNLLAILLLSVQSSKAASQSSLQVSTSTELLHGGGDGGDGGVEGGDGG